MGTSIWSFWTKIALNNHKKCIKLKISSEMTCQNKHYEDEQGEHTYQGLFFGPIPWSSAGLAGLGPNRDRDRDFGLTETETF